VAGLYYLDKSSVGLDTIFVILFFSDNPNEFCSKGGHASYGDAINYTMTFNETLNSTGNEYDQIDATYYMAYHSVCITSVACQEKSFVDN